MVVIKLTKNTKYDKMFVSSWYFLCKESVTDSLNITGVQYVIEESKLPSGFYSNPKYFYLDDGNILRNGKFMVS